MPPPPPHSRRAPEAGRHRRDLRAITADGVAFSIMVGVGETYVPAFALAMGLGETAAGWLVAVPLLAGAVIQLVSPLATRRLRSLRTWIVGCALLQSMSMFLYAGLAFSGRAPGAALYLIATIYWATGLATGPAWNTWVGTLVPRRLRARFFAQRSRLAQLAVLTGLVGAGLALHEGQARGPVAVIFGVLFLVAGAARLVSAALLASQREPAGVTDGHRVVTWRAWRTRWRNAGDGRLLLYMLAVQGAVQVSGPFFTPYMLGELQFDYLQYLVLIGTSFLTKMLVLPTVGAIVHRFGPRRTLTVAGLCIVPLSALWIVSPSLGFLLGVQVVAGAIWGTYELTTFLLLFEHIDPSERTSVLTTYNLAHAVMTVVGALVGGAVLFGLSEGRTGYMTVFALSAGLRLLTVPLLLRIGRIPVRHYAMAVRPLSVRPNSGSLDAPIVSSMEDDRDGGEGRRQMSREFP